MQSRDRLHSHPIVSEIEKFERHVQAGLRYVRYTCVHGSVNKFENFVSTAGNSSAIAYRYLSPCMYYDPKKRQPDGDDLWRNKKYCFDTQKYVCDKDRRYFHLIENERDVKFMPNSEYNPIERVNPSHQELLLNAMFVLEKRQGNCLELTLLLAKYFWENNEGIDSIEIVNMSTADHCYLVLNRQDGELSNPGSWGERAAIVDPWFGDGVIYDAKDFKEYVEEVKTYIKMQLSILKKYHIVDDAMYSDEAEIPKNCRYRILPKMDLYPAPKPLENYYVLANAYSLDFSHPDSLVSSIQTYFDQHKNKFKGCLFDISNKLNTRASTSTIEDKFRLRG